MEAGESGEDLGPSFRVIGLGLFVGEPGLVDRDEVEPSEAGSKVMVTTESRCWVLGEDHANTSGRGRSISR